MDNASAYGAEDCRSTVCQFFKKQKSMCQKLFRGHPELNQGPLDLQSNALPLSYTPMWSANI
nr:hypothetical protein K01A12.1 - Caenorhabditis elegans [Caenorhabditis elegans]